MFDTTVNPFYAIVNPQSDITVIYVTIMSLFTMTPYHCHQLRQRCFPFDHKLEYGGDS